MLFSQNLTFLTVRVVSKDIKSKIKIIGNQFDNILKFFDILPNFSLHESEREHDF